MLADPLASCPTHFVSADAAINPRQVLSMLLKLSDLLESFPIPVGFPGPLCMGPTPQPPHMLLTAT